ncbi:MAG TPA: hypothetical protein V6C65_05735, partial [Allocoleopsis sp.]
LQIRLQMQSVWAMDFDSFVVSKTVKVAVSINVVFVRIVIYAETKTHPIARCCGVVSSEQFLQDARAFNAESFCINAVFQRIVGNLMDLRRRHSKNSTR